MCKRNFENICVRLFAQFLLQFWVNHQHALGACYANRWAAELGFNLLNESKESVTNFGAGRRRFVSSLRFSRILPRLPDYGFGLLSLGARSATE
jgi:hypothetical protein